MYEDNIVNELIESGYYNPDEKADCCPSGTLFEDEGVFVKEDAQNGWHKTDYLKVTYELHEWATEKNEEVTEILKQYHDPIDAEPFGKIFYDDDDETNQIKKNNIFVYTPIVNRIELYENPEDIETANNNNQVVNIDNVINTIKEATGNEVRILNIDEEFLLTIPHDGYHPGCGDATLPSDGYGNKNYNHYGIVNKDEGETWYSNSRFAKEKLVKFSFDVYLARYSGDDGNYLTHTLLPANTWNELSEIEGNKGSSKMRGLEAEDYIFIIPTWVKDNESGDITVRIVASNYSGDDYTEDTVNAGPGTEIIPTEGPVTKYNEKDQYILEQKYSVYLAGKLYDLEVRTTDDVGYEDKLTKALKLARLNAVGNVDSQNRFLPIGQRKQIPTYNTGIKLGYTVYFDLKTKGTASNEIKISPKIYYVSNDGETVTDDIAMYYRPVEDKAKYVKLDNTTLEKMVMTDTKGEVNNSIFRYELARAIKLVELYNAKNVSNPTKQDFSKEISIGSLFGDILLSSGDNKLPYDNLKESYEKYGYTTEDAFITNLKAHIEAHTADNTIDANLKAIIDTYGYNNNDSELKTLLRNFNGHWYGEFTLPQTTKVMLGAGTGFNEKDSLKDGYLVVVFDDIKTTTTPGVIDGEYLSYDMPSGETQWEKEAGGAYDTITLPNGNTAKIPDSLSNVTKIDGTTGNTMTASAMAIYEVGRTRAEDQDTGGTH